MDARVAGLPRGRGAFGRGRGRALRAGPLWEFWKDAVPASYQPIGGERVPVESRYLLLNGDAGGGYGFAVGAYDPRYPLVIDPGLDYSTLFGGNQSQLRAQASR